MLAFIYVFFPLEKLFLSNLDSFSSPPRHLAIYRAFQLLLIAISIASRQLGGSIEISSGSSIAAQSIEVGFCLTVSRHLSIHQDFFFCMHCFSHVLHLSFILSSIASCFITFMHFYGFFVNMWFLFKILHVRGRNTCFCKGEMCFILLGRVLTSFFLYTGLVIMLTYIVHIFFIC